MARLDQLIGAMFKHSAEALVLADGRQPALSLDGTARPIVKKRLDASQVALLLSEIAPEGHLAAVAAGEATTFVYNGAGNAVTVEVGPGSRAVIREAPETPEIAVVAEPSAAPAAPSVEATSAHPAGETAPAAATSPAHETAPTAPLFTGPVTMDFLFHTMVEFGASDLHLSAECRPMLRIDGSLKEISQVPVLDAATAEETPLEIAPGRNREEFAACGDTDFAYEIDGLARFRCNLFKDRKGSGGVFRIIPTKILTADDLGLSKEIQNLCYLTKGLVLVTGPTGSGKSTTLSAMVDLVNSSRSDHVITIEDPIEFVHPNKQCLINQREVHLHTEGFKPALRAALREDPDVVLVGEMRDLETVAIAIETAETGHLVFGTLHTSSAVSTVDRIIDQFPADQQEQIRIMLSESLKAVIAQVLCKRIGGGRVAALEVLMVNAAVSNLIREGKTFQIVSIMQTAKSQGMVTLNNALLDLVLRKVVEPKEAYMKAIDKTNLLAAFKAKNVNMSFLKDLTSENPA